MRMFDTALPTERQALLERETKTYGSEIADDVEKNGNLEPSNKTVNGNGESGHGDNVRSKNFCQRILQSPCGDNPRIVGYATTLIIALLAWALLYTLLGKEVEPNGQLFQLIALVVVSYFASWLVSLARLPPLLGMLVSGIVLRNIGFFNMTGIYTEIVILLREAALTIILLIAGLGLDASKLKKLSFVVARLAFAPCITETVAVAVAAHVIMDMPWLWGILVGLILSAVSPAVVIPNLLILKAQGYGENKGISTLVIAASSLDDIVCISGFGVVLGMVFSQGDLVSNITLGPIEAGLGLTIGLGWGFIAGCIPHRNESNVVLKRSIMVGGGGLVAVLGSQVLGYSGSGPLAAIILSFVASLCWKWQGWEEGENPVEENFNNLWMFLQPLLFGLIGAEINFADIDVEVIHQGLAVLFFGLLIRTITTFIVMHGANLNFKEIIFVNLAWLPKATVQAALGPVALDLAKKLGRYDAIPDAQTALTIAVIAILVTAPIGAIGISVGGPRLLSNEDPGKTKKNRQLDGVTIENQI